MHELFAKELGQYSFFRLDLKASDIPDEKWNQNERQQVSEVEGQR